MSSLIGRAFKLRVGYPDDPSIAVTTAYNNNNATGIDISGQHCEFKVTRSLKPEPPTCAITVYNLAPDTRKHLSGVPKLTLALEAGYADKGNIGLLYLGEVRSAWSTKEGPDWKTHIVSGSKKLQATTRLNNSLGPRVDVGVAVQAIVTALGLPAGNSGAIVQALAAKGVTSVRGSALVGDAAQRMTDFCRSANLEWSYQNGSIQILAIGQLLSNVATFLDSDHGLIGSPAVDTKGVLSCTSLIQPLIQPGALVQLASREFNGAFRVNRCQYVGKTFDKDWYVHFQATRYESAA